MQRSGAAGETAWVETGRRRRPPGHPLSALHIEKTLGGSPEQGAMGPAALALTMGLARLAGQGLVTRLDPFRVLVGGAMIAGFGALGAALATTPLMAYAGFIGIGVVGLLMWFICTIVDLELDGAVGSGMSISARSNSKP